MKKQFFYLYKLIFNELNSKYQVIGKDGWIWSEATNNTGAIKGALAVGIPLNQIQFNEFIPIWEL